MNWAGKVSCTQRADIAAGAATRNGATPLEALIVGHTAAHGAHCWLRDGEQASQIVQRNGRHPHPRSIARARRNAARKGFLRVERVYPFHRPKGAKFRSTSGTTNKSVNFAALGIRDPMTRGQLRRVTDRENAAQRPRSELQPVGPRLYGGSLVAAGTPRPTSTPRQDLMAEFQRMAAPAAAAAERRELAWQQAADERMLATVPRAPPDD